MSITFVSINNIPYGSRQPSERSKRNRQRRRQRFTSSSYTVYNIILVYYNIMYTSTLSYIYTARPTWLIYTFIKRIYGTTTYFLNMFNAFNIWLDVFYDLAPFGIDVWAVHRGNSGKSHLNSKHFGERLRLRSISAPLPSRKVGKT